MQQEQRLERLTEQAKTHGLSAHEQAEADALVSLIEQQMALRSEALLLLQKRGYGEAVATYRKNAPVNVVS